MSIIGAFKNGKVSALSMESASVNVAARVSASTSFRTASVSSVRSYRICCAWKRSTVRANAPNVMRPLAGGPNFRPSQRLLANGERFRRQGRTAARRSMSCGNRASAPQLVTVSASKSTASRTERFGVFRARMTDICAAPRRSVVARNPAESVDCAVAFRVQAGFGQFRRCSLGFREQARRHDRGLLPAMIPSNGEGTFRGSSPLQAVPPAPSVRRLRCSSARSASEAGKRPEGRGVQVAPHFGKSPTSIEGGERPSVILLDRSAAGA